MVTKRNTDSTGRHIMEAISLTIRIAREETRKASDHVAAATRLNLSGSILGRRSSGSMDAEIESKDMRMSGSFMRRLAPRGSSKGKLFSRTMAALNAETTKQKPAWPPKLNVRKQWPELTACYERFKCFYSVPAVGFLLRFVTHVCTIIIIIVVIVTSEEPATCRNPHNDGHRPMSECRPEEYIWFIFQVLRTK